MTLGDYLAAAARRPWEWGGWDCCIFPGDWAVTWGLGDPVAEWRGSYSSHAEAEALIYDAGGLVALWDRGLASIGVARVEGVRPGDVGVIGWTDAQGDHEAGAIWSGKRWALLCPAGVGYVSAEPLAVWGPRHG
jgi:hypothetical protein